MVIPVHNEQGNIAPLLAEIEAALGRSAMEVIAVDDRSTDGSADELRRLQAEHECLRVVSLRRRAGQSAALAAGVDVVRGDTVVLMDSDGQYDPADVPGLLDLLERDPLCVAVVGYRVRRADSLWRLIQSRVANGVRNWLTGDYIRDTGCSLRVIRTAALRRIVRFDGMHRFFPTLLRREGGKVLEAAVSHRPRLAGRSKYGMRNRGMVALRDALGVRWLKLRALDYEATKDDS